MTNAINTLIDFFIHPQLKVNESVYEKSKVTVLAFIIVLFIILPYGIFFTTKGYFLEVKALHNYLGIFITTFGLILIKYTGKTNLALTIVAIVGVYLVSASVYISGGLISSDMLWYMVLSTASFMFISIRTGFIIAALSLLGITLFYFLEVNQILFSEIDKTTFTAGFRFFNYILILSILSLMVFILVRGNTKLQEVVQLNKEQKIREEIARDFHDQIGNQLASLRHLAELLGMEKSEAEKKQLSINIDTKAKDVYNNFRDFIWTLDAKSDQVVELFMYLRDYTEDYFKFSKINVNIESTPDQLPEILLPSRYSKEIVPMVKEVITNIHKHAHASNVNFDFILSKTSLIIKIKDDGIGIDENSKKGNGLRNIQYRAEKVNGELSIFTQKNNGTEIIFTVLLPLLGSKTNSNNT